MATSIVEKVKDILIQILEEKVYFIIGCQELVNIYHEGYDELIPYDYVEFYTELLRFPMPAEYHLWDKKALKRKLREMEKYKNDIFSLTKEFYKEINK